MKASVIFVRAGDLGGVGRGDVIVRCGYIISCDTGLVVNSLMEPWDTGGDNQSVITLLGDNNFQPIRAQHSGNVTKTKRMA